MQLISIIINRQNPFQSQIDYPEVYTRRLRSQAQSGDTRKLRSPMSSYLTTSIIRYEANNAMSREEKERKKGRRGRKKERENNCAARVHAKSERRRSVSYVDPSMLRSPVRASFAMLRSDKHPPLGPSSAHRHPLRAPLQIDRTIPHARRSSCTASSSASPRPHRGRNRGEGASEISHRRVFVPPHTIASSSHLAVAAHLPLPREPDFSFFSPPPPPSPPPSPPPPNLKILSHRPPAAAAIHAFAVLVAPLSPKDPRVVPSGSTPVGPVPSFEIRGSLLRSSSSRSRGSA